MEVNEPAIAYSKQKISVEEYLEMENTSMEKHEYYNDDVFKIKAINEAIAITDIYERVNL